MAKFVVLRPVEHNQVLYVPQGSTEAATARSAGHGGEIPVEASGRIELDAAAAELLTGQIAPLRDPAAETPSRRPKRETTK